MSKTKLNAGNSSGGAVYGLGMLGALYYFLQNASGFEAFIIGIVKSILWPAFVIHKVLILLNL